MEECDNCKHSLTNNMHGIDQNDVYLDENDNLIFKGGCTYCKVCRQEYGWEPQLE